MRNKKKSLLLENYRKAKQAAPSFGSIRPTVILSKKDKAGIRANVKKEVKRLLDSFC